MNTQVCLAQRPKGFPQPSDFDIRRSPVQTPGADQVLVRTLILSVDPYMRGRMSDRKSYARPVEIGEVMVGEAVGVVEKSQAAGFREGDVVCGPTGWQQVALCRPQDLRKVPADLPISTALHVAGMPGLTAYFGLLDVCNPLSGETVVVSGAAGAVGTAVGQIARIHGCRVVGVAGSDEKIAFLTDDLGFDAAVNYKTADIAADLERATPDGIDVYFDNVGGPITDAVFGLINVHGRMAICGQISQYNLSRPAEGPRVLWNLIIKRARVQGLLVTDFADRYEPARQQLAEWVRSGQLKYRERIAEGIEQAPQAFIEMLQGANIGKQLVRVAAE